MSRALFGLHIVLAAPFGEGPQMNAPASFDTPTQDALRAAKDGQFSYENVQFAIEQLYDLRSKVIRIGLLGTLIHRPDPHQPDTQTETQDCLDLLATEADTFDNVVNILETGTPYKGIHPLLARWMNLLAQENPQDLAVIRRVNQLTQRLVIAAQSGSTDQSAALREHRRVARQSFHSAITGLCLFMWHAYDKDQSKRLARTQAAAAALSERLTRLERIGTHVRLVSLNASVEASHIGDRGRGLSVIAQEFKGLAEEVRTLAQEARQDVSMMQELD